MSIYTITFRSDLSSGPGLSFPEFMVRLHTPDEGIRHPVELWYFQKFGFSRFLTRLFQ